MIRFFRDLEMFGLFHRGNLTHTRVIKTFLYHIEACICVCCCNVYGNLKFPTFYIYQSLQALPSLLRYACNSKRENSMTYSSNGMIRQEACPPGRPIIIYQLSSETGATFTCFVLSPSIYIYVDLI